MTSGTLPARTARRPRTQSRDLWAVLAAALLVAAAAGVGAYLNRPASGVDLSAPAAPLFARWLPHFGPGTVFAVLIAVAVIVWGPSLAARMSWRPLLAAGYVTGVAWTFALAMIDGWHRGFTDRLTDPNEYLHEVPGITDIPAMLRGFSSRILDFQPDSWTTHVSGHPPGATLVFVWLDRAGLSGGAWAAAVCVLAGCLVTVAVPVTLSALNRRDAARATIPFAVLFPGTVWIGVSADGLFAGLTATGIALIAVATQGFPDRRWYAGPVAALGGMLLGFGVYLSYGLPLLGLIAFVVVLLGRSLTRALPFAVAGALAVAAAFTAAGFWWFDGYHRVVERYYQGIASSRPYWYWVWADLAALVLAAGPAVVAGVRRVVGASWLSRDRRLVDVRSRDWRSPVVLLVLAAVAAIVLADVSGLSKAEVERIWLPFTVWLLPAVSLLPRRRAWLAGQALTALAVNSLVLTFW